VAGNTARAAGSQAPPQTSMLWCVETKETEASRFLRPTPKTVIL
jgi:hypothetical protein